MRTGLSDNLRKTLIEIWLQAFTWSLSLLLISVTLNRVKTMPDPMMTARTISIAERSWRKSLALYLSLTKPKIYIAISITTLMGLALQQRFTDYGVGVVFALVIAATLASAGGAVLNHYFERDTDRLMERTKGRPLVTGSIPSARSALYFGIGLTIIGNLICYQFLGGVATFWLFLGFFTYVFPYTLWLKHRSLWNVPVGGLCSSFAVLAGDTAVSGVVSTNGIILATLLFFWNPAHFWNLAVLFQKDYAKAGIPMIPHFVGNRNSQGLMILHIIPMIGCSIALGIWGTPGTFYLVVASIAGLVILLANIQNLILVSDRLFRRNFIIANMYLMTLFIGIGLDFLI